MIFSTARRIYSLILSFIRGIDLLYNFSLFKLRNVEYEAFPQINGRIFLQSKGRILIGRNIIINSKYDQNPIGGQGFMSITVFNNARLTIGNGVGISNSAICCAESITIEDEVFIGGDCSIYDTDFHSVGATERLKNENDHGIKTKPIVIKRRAFIGASCIILKGVTVGENSVIGAGSVLSKSVPSNEIWAGNPARLLRRLRSDEVATDEFGENDLHLRTDA